MKYYKELLIAALVVAVVLVLYYARGQGKSISEKERLLTIKQIQYDSLMVKQRESDMIALEALTKAAIWEQRANRYLLEAETNQSKYEAVIRRPVARLSDAGIDSAVNRLVAKSQH